MSHRKIHSHGYVPFSWEEKPGISKFNHQNSSFDGNLSELKLQNSTSSNGPHIQCTRVDPPPLCTSRPSIKSFLRKGSWWDGDPFLATLNSCSKGIPKNEANKVKSVIGKRDNTFSCKRSCDVEKDNFVRLTKLPPIPTERYKARSLVRDMD